MFTNFSTKLVLSFILFSVSITGVRNELEKLPYCQDNSAPGLVLVSTIDGKLSAINSEGELQWHVDTDPGPLLVSNIHNLELTNSGKWVRIIPALSGSLYRFDGVTIDPIPISAEVLLKSSFKYSDDLVIAGGLDVRTYGIGFQTGKVVYVCSSMKCTNNTNNGNEVEDILLLERTTQVVRAVETHSGNERWNFSVGHHNVKLSQISCADSTVNLFNWNVTAVVPDGILLASRYKDNVKMSWQYHFPSPIVRIWKWNGFEMSEIDLFSQKLERDSSISPAIYVGMHKKQLYIHESQSFQHRVYSDFAVAETASLAKIPWKPIPASELLTEDDSTALSILYSSEYVNGHGYYLFSENDIAHCKNNKTINYPALTSNSDTSSFSKFAVWWWKEILIVMFTAIVCNFVFRTFSRNQVEQNVIYVQSSSTDSTVDTAPTPKNLSESSDTTFNSRFLDDFDTLECLGKGGFGVVFEVKQKIDECHYAIKRINLPNEKSKREAVLREVKALAKLEHRNIVRYFNSWVEKPPFGWHQQYDSQWIKEANDYLSEDFTSQNTTTNDQIELRSVKVDPSDKSESINNPRQESCESDSFIVFAENSHTDEADSESIINSSHILTNANNESKNSSETIDDNSNNTDTCSYEASQHSISNAVNWKRPSRKYHSLNDPLEPPVFLYIQMQLCQKHSLKEWLIENKERYPVDTLNIFKQIISAVEYVHLQGLIHRDLKPSNIFFSLDGRIKVGDFGLVKDEEEDFDTPNSSNRVLGHTKEVGTKLYMSPEQLRGQKYNYKVDIYSLGLIFFELLVYFSTDMERIKTLTKVREQCYPKNFENKYTQELELLKMMLDHTPEKRPTTFGVRARSPINCCDNNYSAAYDFELPKSKALSKFEELV